MASHQGMLTLALTVVLLALPSLTYGLTLHVRPTSTNTSCPTHPCHTLSEYAQDPGQYFNDSKLTLQFLPGNHTFDAFNASLIITSIHQLEILGNSSAMLLTRVVCSSHVGLTFKDISKVKIDGLDFICCARSHVVQVSNGDGSFTTYYGLYLQSVQTAEIIDCSFRDSYGSALGVVDSHVVLTGNNSFLNNCRVCSTELCGSQGPKCYGGGVYAHMSNLSFTGRNIFFGNLAYSGGGMYTEAGSIVNISENTSFIGNSATDGGGVYAWNSSVNISGDATFISNSARGFGGGVYEGFCSNVSISENTTISGNSASEGGGVYAWGNSKVDICGSCTFSGNSASRGGGVCALYSSVGISGNTTFSGNSARYNGGGVSACDSSNVDISGSTTFLSNSGSDNGGGVYAESNTNVNIRGNSKFIGNSAGKHGGGVCAKSDSTVSISGQTNFIGNSAGDYFSFREVLAVTEGFGGGVHIGSESSVNISGNTTFNGNSASNGGAVNIGPTSNANVGGNTTFNGNSATHGGGVCVQFNITICENTTFIGNSAVYGGGVCSRDSSNVNISGNTCFIDNSASKHGGGFYAEFNSNANIIGNTCFISNSASKHGGGFYAEFNSNANISGNTTFIGNSASGNGGGVYAVSNSSVIISMNTTFSSNSANHGGGAGFVESSLSLKGNSSFSNCSATVGAAIFAKGTQVNFSGTNVFSGNRAAQFGGGLYADNSSLNLPEYSNTFTANWAGFRGGGIYAQWTKITFGGTGLLSGNEAQLDGGGIYADGSNLSFSGSITIRNNTAILGGGIYLDNNTMNIDGHNFIERNVATYYGGGMYTRRSSLTVAGNNTFIANIAGAGGGISATDNNKVNLNGVNTFIGNRAHVSGGGIWLDNSNLTLNGSNHFVECVASYEGGAIFTYAATASLPGNNTFDSNSATTGGGLHARWSSVRITSSSNFTNNVAVFGGGIYTDNSTIECNDSSTFSGNQANYTGGGIYAARSVVNFNGNSSITANCAARDGGGIYTRDDCVVNLLGLSNYQNNSAGDTGGGISAYQSIFNLAGKITFNGNHAVEGGGFYAFQSNVNFSGINTYITNSASSHGGGFTIMHGTLHLNGSTTFKNNSAASGGGMYIGDSTVDSDGISCFINNTAKSEGGAINTRDSLMQFNGEDMFIANSARNKGAAIYSSSTTLVFQGGSSFVNNSAEYGGGIYSESSNLTFVHHGFNHCTPTCINYKSVHNESLDPENIFHNNTAIRGGAQYFDLYSNFSLYETAHVRFQDNHATEFGGAIYAVDVLGTGQFLSQQQIPYRSKCFFHMLGKEQSPDLNTSALIFVNNTAGKRGGVLYGGLLEKCNFTSDRYTNMTELFSTSILHVGRKDDVGHSISSDPSQLCFCNTSEVNCREVIQSRYIFPGQQVAVSVVAIDQSGLAIPTLIHTIIHSGHNLTVSEIISYETGGNCTSRNYSVTTKNIFNQLELYPNNRSGNTIHLIVNITFESCPIGFEQSNFTGECICDHRLWQYTNSCDIDRQAILRNATRTFWIGVSYSNGTVEGYIHHRYCPLDYCTRESKHINLINPDKQCNYNRSGLLCGRCKESLSLVLGSSQCKYCSNSYLALLIPFALAGVLLVILLLLLHLTVAAGTLHGLIFYANVVAANHHIFFPQSSNNPASIFIAWLNLDLGIQTCFYNGMDVYVKTWLEFVFPVYIWVIVGLLVYISHRSVTVTKLLGSSPVPVLATLFLLSYAKVLRTIIAALSLTILHYPDKDVVVWIHDANVPLAKYIPLVLVALLFILFLFLPYTLLLLLGQWLQPISHICLLSWVRNPKLKAILDTYHAPYKPKYRFWTGLLLLLRCAFFLVFAFNVSGDNSVNLLVTSSATFGIVVGFALLGSIYKSWYLNALELSFILNLGILAVATYHVNQSGGSQAAVAYTSVGIAFLTFVGIITYHIYMRIKSKVQYIQRGNQLQHGNNNCHRNKNNDNPGNLCHQPRATPIVTRTEVNFHELRSPLDLLSYHQMN